MKQYIHTLADSKSLSAWTRNFSDLIASLKSESCNSVGLSIVYPDKFQVILIDKKKSSHTIMATLSNSK